MTANECAAALLERDGYLIISHRRPDGDTIGSGAALCAALRRAGKRAWCYDNPEITEQFYDFIAPYLEPAGLHDTIPVTVDVADSALIPDAAPKNIWLAVDHHGAREPFSTLSCVEAERASCGELVLDIIKAMNGDVSPEEAKLLYVALSTDTGCFQYGNTDAHAHRAAAELTELGAPVGELNIKLFRTVSRARMLLEGRIYSGLRFYRNGKVVVASVTLRMLEECGAGERECEDIAGLAGKAEGNVISVTLRELSPGETKVSMRSKPQADVSAVCAVFGGGGHKMASGCTIKKPPEEALKLVLAAIDEKWREE